MAPVSRKDLPRGYHRCGERLPPLCRAATTVVVTAITTGVLSHNFCRNAFGPTVNPSSQRVVHRPTMKFNMYKTFASVRMVNAIDKDGSIYQKAMMNGEGKLDYFPDYDKLARARDKYREHFTPFQLACLEDIINLRSFAETDCTDEAIHVHHVIPRSLGGHLTDPENLIPLIAGRHFVTHAQYDAVFDHVQLSYAVQIMRGGGNSCYWTKDNYEDVLFGDDENKQDFINAITAAVARASAETSARRTGQKLSRETRDKLSQSHMGHSVSLETRRKISISVSASLLGNQRARK